jgi:glycopeptide antibiotics resistance protein
MELEKSTGEFLRLLPTCYHAFVSAIIPTSALDFNVSFQIEVYLLIMAMQYSSISVSNVD